MMLREYFIDPSYCKGDEGFATAIPIMVKTLVNDISYTWILCRCESMDFARYLVNRLNKISKEVV